MFFNKISDILIIIKLHLQSIKNIEMLTMLLKNNDKHIYGRTFFLFIFITILIEIIIINGGLIFAQPDDYLYTGIIGGVYGNGSNQYLLFYFSPMMSLSLSYIQTFTGLFNIYPAFILILFTFCIIELHFLIYQHRFHWICNVTLSILEPL
jgi:hypothetical protein